MTGKTGWGGGGETRSLARKRVGRVETGCVEGRRTGGDLRAFCAARGCPAYAPLIPLRRGTPSRLETSQDSAGTGGRAGTKKALRRLRAFSAPARLIRPHNLTGLPALRRSKRVFRAICERFLKSKHSRTIWIFGYLGIVFIAVKAGQFQKTPKFQNPLKIK